MFVSRAHLPLSPPPQPPWLFLRCSGRGRRGLAWGEGSEGVGRWGGIRPDPHLGALDDCRLAQEGPQPHSDITACNCNGANFAGIVRDWSFGLSAWAYKDHTSNQLSQSLSTVVSKLIITDRDFFLGGINFRLQIQKCAALGGPYCAIPRDYLSDTPLLRAMGFLVSQHGQLGAIPPAPFLSVSPLGEHAKWRCDTPPSKGVSQRYLRDTL